MQTKTFEFDPKNIKLIPVDKIIANDWNPKLDDTPEYAKIRRSIEINGYASPILTRRKGDKYEIIDGQNRFYAIYELGYQELYIYDAGEVSDEEAKAMTLFMQTQVPFEKTLLAPLAMELNKLNMELPFSDKEMFKFEKIASQDFDDVPKTDMDSFKDLKIRMTQDQFDFITNAIKTVAQQENVSDGRALELLVGDGFQSYNTGEVNE